MLNIRPEQMRILSEDAERRFVQRMAGQLRKHYPERCATLGDEKLLEAIRLGMARAGRHGVWREREYCLWLHLMLVLGGRFDEDPNLPWARAILADAALSDPIHKVHRLYEAAERYLQKRH